MRLFVAVDLDETARAAAAGSAQTLATRLPGADPPSPVRWVPPEQLHLTLRFLGEVCGNGRLRRCGVRSVGTGTPLRSPPASPVSISFRCPGAPRVIWLGVDTGREQMVALKSELDRRLAPVGF